MESIGNRAAIPRQGCSKLRPCHIEILRYLAENRFATLETIETRFWNGRGNGNHYRTMRRLLNRGLVAPLLGDGGKKIGYHPTRRALKVLRSRGVMDLKVTDLRSTYRTNFDHDQTLQVLRSIFESSPLVSNFEPEHAIREVMARKYGYADRQEQGYKVPDARFGLKTAKGTFRVALELEISEKGRQRYRAILKRLLLSKDWDVVFFVVEDDRILEKLKAIVAESKEQDLEVRIAHRTCGMYFAQLSKILLTRTECTFDGEGKSFSLASLQDELVDCRAEGP